MVEEEEVVEEDEEGGEGAGVAEDPQVDCESMPRRIPHTPPSRKKMERLSTKALDRYVDSFLESSSQ